MPRFAPVMNQADLRQILIDKAIANNYIEDYDDIDQTNPKLWSIVDMLLSEELVPDVIKDWEKIDFSTENLDVTAEKVTPEGIPYLQIRTGGDWETPLIAALYFDGKKLRGYIPKDGNTYNHRKKAAFGNNDDDNKACIAQFGDKNGTDAQYKDIEPDFALVDADIAGRIKAKGTYTYNGSKVVSKAAIEAAKQAEIEKDQDLTGPMTKDMVYAVIDLAAGCSYVQFKLRSSGRMLTKNEADRLVGMPSMFEKTEICDNFAWYAPQGCYPMQTFAVLEREGFEKAPDNDLTPYANARTHVIRI